MPALQEMGVARIFTPGATTQEIVEWARSAIPTRV
jgi:methylmalonyl-CoA mutase C-terminal domain/subunit